MSEIYFESDRTKLVYICSPYRGNIRKNTSVARRICRGAMLKSKNSIIPIAPHLLYTQFLNDADDKERQIGLRACQDLIARCDELWAYIPKYGPTEGMRQEIAVAKSLRIPIIEFSFPGGQRREVENATDKA